ncbi:hypothetical protein FQN50_006793 [Emmonsiellopsis sp. PD_5]|nr:hypothetical protein FQN50_006793 [Emmonsiellopsis sp. PD_5]
MAELSPDEISIIEQYPLADSLDRVHGLLQEAERVYESRFISYDGSAESLDRLYQKAISRLLSALQGGDTAFNLRSRITDQNIDSDLAGLKFKHLRPGRFNYSYYRRLVQHVIQNALDSEIWEAVFNLITTISQTSPPLSIPPSFAGTPVRSTSSSQRGSEQTRRLLEGRLFEEIRECTHRGVGGFFAKYFEGKDWNAQAEAISCHLLDSGRVTSFPNPPTEKDVLNWWFQFQDDFLSDTRAVYFTTAKSDLTGSDADQQVDLLLRARGTVDTGGKHNWKDIWVVGELKQSESEIRTKGTLLQMARYVREVFIAQPTRQFVHAFMVCGFQAEAWVFDRSGPFSSGSFNIHEDPKRFFQMIVGYTMMSDEELGLDTFITHHGGGVHTITTEAAKGGEIVVHLDPRPLCSQYAIVCRGTTCFLSNIDEKVQGVAKFSWTSDKRAAEKDLLKLAHERGVKGVTEVVGYCDIATIANLRAGLIFEKRHVFRSVPSSAKSSFNLYHSHDALSQSFTRKRKSPDKGLQPSKRSLSSSQLSRAEPQETELPFTVRSMQPPSLFDRNSKEQGPYDNRILRCLVISPAGRPVYKYHSPMELLMALRDAIKAHRSLYQVGNILHRDISEANVIITDPGKGDGNSGMLIDLDLAKEIGSGRSGARYQTGTMEFMAIEVLRAVDHTYRHDLESFFYVLIWQCAWNGWERFNRLKEKPDDSLLNEWYTGSFKQIAGRKGGHMDAKNFEYLLLEFPPELECVKPLCKAVRRILFPIHQDALFTGTPATADMLYDPIVQAFDNGIEDIKAARDTSV